MTYKKIKPFTADEIVEKSVKDETFRFISPVRIERIEWGADYFRGISPSMTMKFGEDNGFGAVGELRLTGDFKSGKDFSLMNGPLEMEMVIRPARR